jgi:hypothetical protein
MPKYFVTRGGRLVEVEAPDEAAARAFFSSPLSA